VEQRLAERQREPGQKVAYVKVKGLKPARSRLLKPEVAVQSGEHTTSAGERGTS
jgi:hypothetical protein